MTHLLRHWGAAKSVSACLTAFGLSTLLMLPAFLFAQPVDAADTRIRLVSGRASAKVKVAKGKPRTVKTDQAFSEIVVGDPEIATISPLTDDSFYVLGKSIGTTGIALFDKNQALVGSVDVEVTYDVDNLNAKLRGKLKKSRIKASTVNGRIVLNGMLARGSA